VTNNLPAERKAHLQAGAPVAALVPQTLEEAFRLATALAASGMAPRGIDKPEQIMVAIMAGAELGLAPFQALQSFAVVNGRPTLWGDGLMAVVRARGVRVKEWLDGEGEAMVAHCIATRPDTGEEIARAFTVADAKKAALWGKQGPWQQYPKRMLQMRARALALRDGCADMLRGIQIREEVEDYQTIREVRAPPAGLAQRLTAAAPSDEGFTASQAEHRDAEFVETGPSVDAILDGDTIPAHDAGTGEIIEKGGAEIAEEALEAMVDEVAEELFPGDRPSSPAAPPAEDPNLAWGRDFLAWIPTASPKVITEAWAEAKRAGKPAAVQNADPDLFDALIAAKDKRLDEARGRG
jgi:hypothetical protein